MRPGNTGPVIGAAFAATLAKAQDGDEAAFTCIFRDVQPVLVRYLRVIAPGAADDVAGDTWVRVVDGLAGFRGDEAAFRAWLFTIARHRATDWGRWRARHPTVALEGSGAADRPTAPDAAEVALEQFGLRAALTAVAQLPRDQAEIIMLRVVAGLDTREVARITGKSPGAVRVAAHRGLRRLASLASSMGVIT
jgi:RNA polymerase sigma-70 factor, ECF subfamily